MALRPYQLEAAERLARGSAVGLWMAAGLGKTATALHAWHLMGRPKPVLIVTRAIGRHVWPRDAKWLLGDESFGILWAGTKRSKTGIHKNGTFSCLFAALEAHNGVVTNYEVLGKRLPALLRIPWKLLIFDEAHALKMGHLGAKKDKNKAWIGTVFSYSRRLARQVQQRGPYGQRGHVWEITATPIRDRVRDYWGQLNIALKDEFPNTSRGPFMDRYCAAFINDWGGWDTTGSAHLPELKARLRPHFVHLDRETVAEQLPMVQRDVREVDTKKLKCPESYGHEDAISFAASLKHDAVVDLALEYLGSECKCVIATTRRKLAAQVHGLIADAVHGPRVRVQRDLVSVIHLEVVTGETPPHTRIQRINAFNEYNGPGVLVATTDSISESVNLHYVDALIVAALPYTPAQIVQLEGRVGRLGGKPCTIHYLVASDTIDEKIRFTLLDKLSASTASGGDTQGGKGAESDLRTMRDESAILASLISWLENTGGENDECRCSA